MQKLPHEPSFEQAKILVAGDLNIIDTVIRRGTFTTFIRLVQGSSLEKTLGSESSFTLFAPADMAFTGLPADTLK